MVSIGEEKRRKKNRRKKSDCGKNNKRNQTAEKEDNILRSKPFGQHRLRKTEKEE